MRTKLNILLLGLILAAGTCFATYQYGLNDPLTSINGLWTQNGSVTAMNGPTTFGLTTTTSSGGSLIFGPNGGYNYTDEELKVRLNLTASGGSYVAYVRATGNAWLGTSAQGTFYAVEVQNPTLTPSGCSATLLVWKNKSGLLSQLASSSIPCRNGMEIRAIMISSKLQVLVDNVSYVSLTVSGITSGRLGVGEYNVTPSGNSISLVSFGDIDRIAPSVPALQGAATLVLPNRIDVQWPGTPDDANGIGVGSYVITRNGAAWITVPTPEFSDQAVSPGTAYQYGIKACDWHLNCSAASTKSVTSAPAGAVDPRRVGTRPDGAYWGGGGEQIDTRSGNLNFSIPLLKAMGRGGWGVPFGLSYNSQLWRQDGTTTWELGRDTGPGFGWRLAAGSITPYWNGCCTVHHYTYTDSTGAEYILSVNTNGIWTSTETGVYVEYDATARRLYFPSGMFWYMGSTSTGLEDDAGSQYPTIIEDTNGNQVKIQYLAGSGALTANSSARIDQIFDVRGGGNASYSFTWSVSPYNVTTITNTVGLNAESWALNMGTATRVSPFDGTSFGTKQVLNSLSTYYLVGMQYTFTYNTSGELTSVVLPHGGTMRWDYRSYTYPGSRSLREVQSRYLTKAAGAQETTYSFYHDDVASSQLHSWTAMADPSGPARAWCFFTDGSGPMGALSYYDARPTVWANPVLTRVFGYAQDPAGRNYINAVVKTIEPFGANLQSKTSQTVDAHGNVTQTQLYGYGNLTTPVRTYTSTYNAYSAQHIWNRLSTSSVTDGTNNITLVSNSYDNSALTDIPCAWLALHDCAYTTSSIYRGNVTTSTSPGSTRHFSYDVAGNATSANDDYGHSVSSTFSSATQYAAPDAITPNGNDDLSTNYGYNSFLGTTSVDTADTSASMTYDVVGRPSTATSPYGAVTTYTYSSTNVNLITTTTGTRIVKTTLDGLGRTIKVETSTTATPDDPESVVETQYDSCACSPLGKVKQVSSPYKPGNPPPTVYWTVYGYDALGRTTTITLPDNSVSTYSYSGTTTTVTDPAGKWKTYTTDAMGNLTQVTEPAPEGGTHLTTYAYNVLNQLTTVTMPRSTGTQTRTFNYDLTGNYPYSGPTAHLMSVTNPESGTTSFEYNDDGSLFRTTDAKGQKIKLTYDTLGRVTVMQTYKSDGTEDLCGKATNYWDTRPSGVGGADWENVPGRLMAVRWSASSCAGGQFTEGYQYDTGLVTIKRLYAPPLGANSYIDASFTYTNQGQLQSMAYPVWHGNGTQWPTAGKTFTYTLDTLSRPVGLTEGQTAWVSGVTYGGANGPAGQMTAMVYGGYTENFTYNARGQLTTLTATGNGLASVNLQYNFPASPNNDGRLSQLRDLISVEDTNYQYDSLGRLTDAHTTGTQWGQTFSYDGFGNLTAETATKGTPPSVTRTYDPATNRLTNGYTYDANGNLTVMPGLTMTYNVENRLTHALDTLHNVPEDYGYDTAGLRLWKQGPDGVTHVYYNGPGGKPLADFYLSGGSMAGGTPMVYFAGKRVDNQSVEDRLGTAVVEGGTSRMAYFPYGELRSGTSTEVQFATYKRDSTTNLDYAHQRYYSTQIARFLTVDPAPPEPGEPQSWNRYSYVGGDPINTNDPSGALPEDDEGSGVCDDSEFVAPHPVGGGYFSALGGGIWNLTENLDEDSSGKKPQKWVEGMVAVPVMFGARSRRCGAGASGVPKGSLTDAFRTATTAALNGLSDKCKSALGGVGDLIEGVGSLRFFDGRKTDGDGAYKLSEIAIGNGSGATVYSIVNNRPDSNILNALVIPGHPRGPANDVVLVSGNFFVHQPVLQAGILVEEAMHGVRAKLDSDLTSMAKKHGYDDFQDWILSGCGDKTSGHSRPGGIAY